MKNYLVTLFMFSDIIDSNKVSAQYIAKTQNQQTITSLYYKIFVKNKYEITQK